MMTTMVVEEWESKKTTQLYPVQKVELGGSQWQK